MWGKDILCERAETVYNIYAAQTPLSLIVEIEQVKQKGFGGRGYGQGSSDLMNNRSCP